ncbi:MAG: hypothetical protein K8E66_11270, partial [Phycisphaerales bacterium]|nr:hypothetical protein [Phycisphaerales bacterium]
MTNTTAFDLNNVAYDRDGNITALQRQRSGNESYTYGYVAGSGRLSAVTGTGAAAGTFAYDRNGAITSITGGAYAQSSLYGRNGLPYQITSGGQTNRYLYDGTGQRVYQSAGDGRYIVRGAFGEELAEYTVAGKLNAHMLGGYGRAENTGVKVGYVTDYLGSVRVAVESGGTVRQVVDYYPFGLQMPGRTYVSGTPTREGFTGHELDAETSLNYMGARYYMPALGRFTSVDGYAEGYPS